MTLKSEAVIITSIAKVTLARRGVNVSAVDWDALIADYDRIRDESEVVIPGFEDFNRRQLNHADFGCITRPAWAAFPLQRATLLSPTQRLPETVLHQRLARRGADWLTLQTLRNHDQYNTTVYGYDDRYRGVRGASAA